MSDHKPDRNYQPAKSETAGRTTSLVVEHLNDLFAGEALNPRYEEYLNKSVRLSGKDNFYNRIKNDQGTEDAEIAITEWNKQYHYIEFAPVIKTIARGLLDLALTDTNNDNVVLVEPQEWPTYFPTFYDNGNPTKMVFAFNKKVASRQKQPIYSEVFGPNSLLGLKAVALWAGVDNGDGHAMSQAGVVLPDLDKNRRNDAGFVVATIDNSGFACAHKYGVDLLSENNQFLRSQVGIISLKKIVAPYKHDGSVDEILGHPGATDYLAKHLPKLGDYLSDLSTKI